MQYYNSSDIFNLREVKRGENDGSQMFSIDGSRSFKLNRRRLAESRIFPIGDPSQEREDEIVAEAIGSPDKNYPKDDLLEQQEAADDVPEIIPCNKSEKSASKASSHASHGVADVAEVEDVAGVGGYEWKRNPLTGEGIDVPVLKKWKRRPPQKLSQTTKRFGHVKPKTKTRW